MIWPTLALLLIPFGLLIVLSALHLRERRAISRQKTHNRRLGAKAGWAKRKAAQPPVVE